MPRSGPACWRRPDPFRQSAVIAYYSIFSLPALLVLIVSIAQAFLGREAVMGSLSNQVDAAMGNETAEQIEDMIAAASLSGNSIPATIIGTFYGMNITLPGGLETGPWTFLGTYTTLIIMLILSVAAAFLMYWSFRRVGWVTSSRRRNSK